MYAESTRDSLLLGRHRLLAAVGLDDMVIVEMADAVLVARKDRVQDRQGGGGTAAGRRPCRAR